MEMRFGKILKELRIENKMTQQQLGWQVRVTDRTIRDWENENIEPCYATLGKLAQIFNVTVGQLLGFEDL